MWHKKWTLLSIILIVVLLAGAGLYRIFTNVMRGESYQVVYELDLPKWVRDLAQNKDAHFEEIMAAVEEKPLRQAWIFLRSCRKNLPRPELVSTTILAHVRRPMR